MSQDLQQLKLGDKVKLKLEQPAIICSGREKVECYYRATVSFVDHGCGKVHMSFRSYGQNMFVSFNTDTGLCETPDYLDLKIIS